MDNEIKETQICPHCAEEIKATARVCPHCQRTIRSGSWKTALPIGIVIAFIALVGKIVYLPPTTLLEYILSFIFNIFIYSLIVSGIIWILRKITRKENKMEEEQGEGKAIASLVLGIVGVFAWLIPLIGFPVAIVGLILGIGVMKSSYRGMAIAGIVLNIIFLVLTIINSASGIYMGATGQLGF